MKRIMIIISLISLVLIAVGCGQSQSEQNLERFNRAKDKMLNDTQKTLDNYYRNNRP